MKILYGILLCLIIACSDLSPRQEPVEETVMSLQHYLIPIDSIGVEIGDSNYVLGSIWASSYMVDGQIAILDRSSGSIKFFTETGEFVKEFAPVGEGPGEFLSLDRMSFDSNSNMLLGSFYDRKIAWFDSDLTLLSEIIFTSSLLPQNPVAFSVTARCGVGCCFFYKH